jgi:maleamate amidohydrolase
MQENDLTDDYAHAGFGGTLPFGAKPALLLVDPVLAYLDPDCPLYAGTSAHDALSAMVSLRQAAHDAAIPVIFTGVCFQKGGLDGGLFYQKVPALRYFEAGHPMAAFPDALRPQETDIVVMKNYASAFFGTSLASTLHALRVDCVLIGGYSTSGCVRASTLDTLQSGFAPFVVRDACADRDDRPHEANLFDMQAKYGEVIDLQTALTYLKSHSAL